MCFYLRVYCRVIQNLMVRLYNNLVNCYYNGISCSKSDDDDIESKCSSEYHSNFHDYVVVTEIELVGEQHVKKIEVEPYYRTVDRSTAEDILTSRVDGSCLVRPYKETDACIKYIVSVYAQNNFFHLYIRKISGMAKYGIGLEKPFEKLFNAPSDIINYYRLNKLLCTNRQVSISLVLVPIS